MIVSKQSRRQFLGSATSFAATMGIALTEPNPTAAQGNQIGPEVFSYERSNTRPNSFSLKAEAIPDLSVIALNRLAFGPRPGDVEAFTALGATPEERLIVYVDQQLNPAAIDDRACTAILAQHEFQTRDLMLTELWKRYAIREGEENQNNDTYLPVREVRMATFISAVYSKCQLVEVLADFWHNHFNVYGWGRWAGATFRHYDRDVIRSHTLGNFREMLEAVAKSPAMIYYLDNQTNQGSDPNENFSRELFELHTLGAENYLGVRNPADPDLYDQAGNPIGYVDDWIYGATTCFTGWRINTKSGTFEFDDTRHFPYQKFVLGKILPSFQGIKDGYDVLDMLAAHPGTAQHVCRKLCQHFVSDNPPDSLVARAAGLFMASIHAPDQLKQVVRLILLSPEFRTTWGEKVKRPFNYTISAMRAMDFELTPFTTDIIWRYDPAGQALFSRDTPDGYPTGKEAWLGTMSMLQRMRICNYLIKWELPKINEEAESPNRFRPEEQTPAELKTPQSLVDFWVNRILGRSLSDDEVAPIVDFMAFGRSWTQPLPEAERNERLPYMISLIIMGPTFMLQ